jgi:tetratricopeptide (TPR) repeat protein
MPLYLAGGGYMLSVMLFFNFSRFRLPFMPLLFLFAGAGAVATVRAARAVLPPGGRPAPRRLLRPAALVAAGLLAYAVSSLDLHSGAEEPFQDRLHLAAAWAEAGQPERSEAILRETIRDAEELLRKRGWRPGSGPVPGGIGFSMALHAAWRDLGAVLTRQGRTSEAIDALRAAIPFDPDDAGPYQTLGDLHRQRGELAEAAEACRRGLAARPGAFTLRFDLATILYDSGDPAGALRELTRARELNPSLEPLDLADWHVGMGTVLLSWPGRREEALRHLREGLRLNPSHPQAGAARSVLSSASG